jgi:hypothetical protein
MKFIIVLMAATCSLSAFAQDSTSQDRISGEKMANLLGSSKVAPCLAKLYALESEAELFANPYGFKVAKGDSTQEIQTAIEYRIIKGGDMIAGEAKIIVIEKLYPVMEAPPGVTVPKVVDCKFESRSRF